MQRGIAPKPKRRRASAPKTRTGCGTCKIRHKRCDETKPVCNICSRTGRICDGYIDPSTGQRFGGNSHSHSHGRVSSVRGLAPRSLFANEEEAQGFRFFETATGIQMAAALGNHGWTPPLLQLSHQNPAICYAVIANGIMSRRYEVDELFASRDLQANSLRQTALQQYGKAVACFRSQLAEGNAVLLETAPACCVLLIMFEFMQGNADGVLLHLKNATRLTASIGTSSQKEMFVKLLALIDMVVALWLNLDLSFSDASLRLPNSQMPLIPHSDLTALSYELANIKNDVMSWRHAVACAHRDPKALTTIDLVGFVTDIQSRLDSWYYEFVAVVPTPQDIAEHRGALLRANYLVTALTVDAVQKQQEQLNPATSPTGPDLSKLKNFYEITELAEAVLSTGYLFPRYASGAAEESLEAVGLLPLFSFRHSFIYALFYVAQNAPDRPLRQRAIRLLLERPWREGAWDSFIMGSVAERSLDAGN
ncbi:hypothetical protein PISL3812_00119 [Talaromyces islandicus]|uniref:Zn(2)-C6 fungal-type domain-containing protein n=1 Tax=Talaromyces islandicus TaxID=28573 RepID=A0A0U1LID0_TALIS|nr:hypothetical protein PISL3812_00119 [Talaromyces islandicus]